MRVQLRTFDREFRGEVLQPSTARLLDQIGLLPYILEQPHLLLREGARRTPAYRRCSPPHGRNTAEGISHKCREDPEFPRIARSHINIQRSSLHRKVNLKFLTLFTLLVCVSAAFGQTNTSYYVSTTGNDSSSGTQPAPWRAIQHAADTAR